jgi:transposase
MPAKLSRAVQMPHYAAPHRLRRKIENMFARLTNWRRVATHYNRCPTQLLSAYTPAAIVIYPS